LVKILESKSTINCVHT